MKKVIYSLAILLILVLCSNVVLAAQSASFGISLSSSKTNVNPGDEITVTLKVKNFKNTTEGIYAFFAKIEYDNNFFETLTENSVKGLGTWSSIPTFNPQNGQITADSGSGVKTESDVFSITFKVKDTAQVGKSTQIVVKDFEASEGDTDISADSAATVTINVIKKVTEDTENDNNNNNDNTNDNNNNDNNDSNEDNSNNDNKDNNTNNNNNSNNTNNNNNNSSNDKNNNNSASKGDSTASTDDKLPQTGENMWMVMLLIALAVVIGIVSYKSYKKYNNI